MKKRLLITSIVMMLVVAVALSTATYAWFTSNSNVTASTITMTAATNDEAALAIKWDTGTYGTTIATTAAFSSLAPMIPNELTDNTTTLGGSGAHKITFQTAKIHTVGSDSTFFNVGSLSPVAFSTAAGDTPASKDTIYIKNTSTANTVNNLKVTATINAAYVQCTAGEKAAAYYTYYTKSGDQYVEMDPQPVAGASLTTDNYKMRSELGLVRIAVFTQDLTTAGTNDTSSEFYLRGVLSNVDEAATYFGTIDDEDSQSAFHNSTSPFTSNTYSATAATNGFNICFDGGVAQSLAAQGEIAVKVIVWLDGEALNDDTQGATTSISLRFDAV